MENRGVHFTFKKIIDESTDLIFLADGQYPFQIFYSNKSFEAVLNESVVDKTLVDLGVDLTDFRDNQRVKIQIKNRHLSFEYKHHQGFGENYMLFHKGVLVKEPNISLTDNLSSFFENSLDVFGVGEGTSFTWVSNSVTTVLDYMPSEFTDTSLVLFVHPEDREGFKTELNNLKSLNKVATYTYRFKSKFGAYKWMEWNVIYIQDKFHAVGRDIHQVKEDQIRLDSQNQLFRMGEGAAKFGVWEIDLNTYNTVWSREIYDIHQVEEGRVFNIFEWISLCLPQYQSHLKSSFGNLLETGRHFDMKVQISTYNNERKWVRIIGKGEMSGNMIIKAFGTYQDITEEEDMVRELRLYKELLDLTPDSVHITDLDGKLIFQNKVAKARALEERSASSPAVMNFRDIEPVFHKTGAWEKHIDLLRKNKAMLTLSEHLNDLKSPVQVELNTTLVLIQEKEYVLVISRDISERISLESSLRESTRFLERVTDQMPGVLYQLVFGEDGKLHFPYISSGINRIFGISDEEFEKHGGFEALLNRIHPKDVDDFVEGILQSAQTFKSWDGQFRILSQNGEKYKWVQASSIPEKLSNGEITWYGYFTDITDIKKTEDSLEKAKIAAEEANKTKSDFLSMISHEIRTPLNAISGSVYSMLQEALPQHLASSLSTINFATENLITIINDLLDFQKLDFGKLTLEKRPIQVKKLAQMVVDSLTHHAKDTGNELNLWFEGNMDIEVLGDKVRIGQILNNLITNALKFTKGGKVDVKVSNVGLKDNMVSFYFEVKDTGVGIPAEFHEKIFHDFEQVSNSFSRKYGGTGLGLSITKKLLTRMDSTIYLESEVGQGSKFYFTINLEVNTSEAVPIVKDAPVPHDHYSPKLSILVAEDNEVNALVLGKIIRRWGFDYDRVSNGLEAVDAVGKKKYDVILMDIQMPVMNGLLATETIKSISKVPVIALTAASKSEIKEEIQENGFDGYVSKPIDAEQLLLQIQSLVAFN
ncbi:PAS domain-containing hybrid sensor histidine kinase/response regulator [Anditalea andensis]|uniref:histidine kinase n=1 Tax=Anditalea andensis TaxID=1048983 RepID=A0A074KY46_9BACT|nr:PAS domain-containing protein [Anditalea andensis]KEO73879.1 hypothetical protein EL17_10280 [Anditalea andensis]